MNASRRGRFHRWRHTRPFWGGLLAIIAGLELVSIPLGPMTFTVQQSLAGIASWLVGVLLVALGVLVWVQPQHRLFYGILTILLALVSFLTSNLGGFLLGMLLGIVGGALIFGWTPEQMRPNGRHHAEPPPPDSKGSGGIRILSFGLVPAVLGAGALSGPNPAPTPPFLWGLLSGSSPSRSGPSPAATPPSGLVPSPRPPADGPKVRTPGTAEAGPKQAASGAPPCPKPPADAAHAPLSEIRADLRQFAVKQRPCVAPVPAVVSDPAVFVTYTDPARLTAASLAMFGLTFDGVVTLPSQNGPIRLLKFTMDRAVFDDAVQTLSHGPITQRATTPSLTFRRVTQRVAIYTTRFSGSFLGIPLTFTPDSPPPIVLPNMLFTNVTADHPVATADQTKVRHFTQTI